MDGNDKIAFFGFWRNRLACSVYDAIEWGWIPHMITSSKGNTLRVTGPLCGEFTDNRWIPRPKASDAQLWCFNLICTWINGWVNNREAGDLRCHGTHCDVIVMNTCLTRCYEYLHVSSIVEMNGTNIKGGVINRVVDSSCRLWITDRELMRRWISGRSPS